MKRTYVIDGTRFSTLDEFYDEVSRVLFPGLAWGKNLDAFNDVLRGGFGTPPEGFVLHWENSDLSRQKLGYPETVQQLQRRLLKCHPSNREKVTAALRDAEKNIGPTVFDWLVDIIQEHRSDGVDLELV